jgi:hypothetical protein
MGGLGNQMFQYAFGLSLEKNMKVNISYAVDQIGTYGINNKLEINRAFNIELPIIDENSLKEILKWRHYPWSRRALGHKNLKFIRGHDWVSDDDYSYHFVNRAILNGKSLYFHGYWQNTRLFDCIQEHVRDAFVFRASSSGIYKEYLTILERENVIGVHFRAGDYRNKRNIGLFEQLTDSYFDQAISEIRRHYGDLKVFVFSNDKNFAAQFFSNFCTDFEIVDINSTNDSYLDLALMSKCKHLVISNSTFSWWASWLNERDGCHVAPKNWYRGAPVGAGLKLAKWILL